MVAPAMAAHTHALTMRMSSLRRWQQEMGVLQEQATAHAMACQYAEAQLEAVQDARRADLEDHRRYMLLSLLASALSLVRLISARASVPMCLHRLDGCGAG